MTLKAARNELSAARRALENMKSAKSFEVFEEEWRDFLNCVEKVWVKTERSSQHIRSKFQPWQGKYTALRRKDMLLRYLKQTRDADNYSIQKVAELKPGRRTMNFANPKGGYIKHMEIQGGNIVHYEGDPMIVIDHAPTVEAVRVQNSGIWYNPPTSHLDQKVTSRYSVELAELGLNFYETYVSEAVNPGFRSRSTQAT